jgi:hypothetical protein
VGALCAVLTVAGCSSDDGGTTRADLEDALAVELSGFHQVDGPEITAVCDPSPSGGGEPPGLPEDIGTPVSVSFARAEATVEAYAWAVDETAARSLVDDVAQRADDCAHEVFADGDTDGDGEIDAGSTDVQTAGTWEGSGWTGLLVHREVDGLGSSEMVERRLVHEGDVVLLAVLRSDRVDDATAPLDDLLEQVHDRLG